MKVTIVIVTYNNEAFIREAIDSILMQQVHFPYEVILIDDCSTDRTRDIVLFYQTHHPEIIRLHLLPENKNNNEDFAQAVLNARGEYVALLDGDDYWTSPHKLQKQVDFLDRHPECTVCFHNAIVFYEDGSRGSHNWPSLGFPEITTLEDIWMGNYITTCSTMFRSRLFDHFPHWYRDLLAADWALHILNAEHGHIGYIDEVMGAYRRHSGGIYSRLSQMDKLTETLKFYRHMNAGLHFKYDDLVQTAIAKYFIEWAEEYLCRDDIDVAKQCFKLSFAGRPVNKYVPLKRLVGLWLRLYLPGQALYRKLAAARPH